MGLSASRVPAQIMTSHGKSAGQPSAPQRLTVHGLPRSLRFSAEDRRLGKEIREWIGANDLGPPAQDYAQRMADLVWCQGFSEPSAGSDLAAVRTAAFPDGDALVLTGQKVWISRAELSKWSALLVRTDQGAVGHDGLSVLIVYMDSPGITVRPLLQVLHEPRFSEVFFDEVRVPIANVLGDINGGWGVAMAAMRYERGLVVLERQVRLRRRLEDLTDELRAAGRMAEAADRIGRVAAKLDVLQAQAYRTLGAQVAGDLAPGATSVDKLFLAEVYQELFSVAYDLLGPDMVSTQEWADDLLESRSVSIYSGTSEIQRNIISRQLLGLR
jgi:alkylation response protein AidB-like acyl-CoA dehydrogenase